MKTRFLPFALLLLSFGWQTSQAQWTSLGSGITATPRTLASIYPINENVVWGFTWHATSFVPVNEFTRTTDGGQSWYPGTMTGVEAGQFPIYLFPLDDQTAWLSTADELNPISGRIYKTTNGGSNWVHQSTGFTGFNETPAGVYFWNENEGFAYGATCYDTYDDQIAIYTTADGGENWTKVVAPNMPAQLPGEGMCLWNFAGFFSVMGNNVWFGTTKGRIFKSTDKGLSWAVVTSPFPDSKIITSVAFKDANTGIALGANPLEIKRTTDGGMTWTALTPTLLPGSVAAQVEYIPGTKSTWMIISSPTKYMLSYNDGDTWETHDSNIDVWSVEFLDAKTGFAGSYTANPTTASLFKWSGPALGNRLFVNDDAGGANDGSSWADAFTNLQSALAIADEGDQIWVAEGIYKPDEFGGNPASTYLIDKNIQLYGGFSGTEATLVERGDPADHPTILSGDLNGDDVLDDFVTNREDNSSQVISISETADGTVLDGFTIVGGTSKLTVPGISPSRGGGVTSLASCSIINCIFRQNTAEWGGAAVYARFGDEVLVENCIFEANSASRGALALGFHNDAQIINCQFIDNVGSFGGAGAYLGNLNVAVRDCEFTNNRTPGGDGGAIFLWHNPQIEFENPMMTIENCTFKGNQANWGGGISFNHFIPGGHLEVQGCSFDNNAATSDGGGLSVYNANTTPELLALTLTGNHFKNNTSAGEGGGVWMYNLGSSTIQGCTFDGNNALNGGGFITHTTSDINSPVITLDECTFSNNVATNNGSGLYAGMAGSEMTVQVKNCQFTGNTATNFSAAADFWGTQGGTGSVLVDNCTFENNTSAYSGALEMGNGYSGGASIDYTLTNSTFLSNESTEGGAIDLWSDELSIANFHVENCIVDGNKGTSKGGGIMFNPQSDGYYATVKNSFITNNESPDGGAIDIYQFTSGLPVPANATISIENCLIAGNTSNNAAISVERLPNFSLLNLTIADNAGGGIELSDQSGLTLQNTVFANPGHTEYTASTNSTFTSNGGNLILDTSLNAHLTALDKSEIAPGFMSGSFEPSSTSPLINAGVNAGVTALFDLAGNERIQHGIVDIGAFESPFLPTTAKEIIAGEAAVSPNPASVFLNIELPVIVTGNIEVRLFDTHGRAVSLQTITAGQPVDVKNLSPGFYMLKATVGDKIYTGKFVKQ